MLARREAGTLVLEALTLSQCGAAVDHQVLSEIAIVSIATTLDSLPTSFSGLFRVELGFTQHRGKGLTLKKVDS